MHPWPSCNGRTRNVVSMSMRENRYREVMWASSCFLQCKTPCSLEQRRLHFDLFICYHIILGLVSVCVTVCVSDFFELNCASLTRGHPYKLHKPRTYNTVRASYFSIRIVNVWNVSQLIELISPPLLLSNAQIDFAPFLLCSHT